MWWLHLLDSEFEDDVLLDPSTPGGISVVIGCDIWYCPSGNKRGHLSAVCVMMLEWANYLLVCFPHSSLLLRIASMRAHLPPTYHTSPLSWQQHTIQIIIPIKNESSFLLLYINMVLTTRYCVSTWLYPEHQDPRNKHRKCAYSTSAPPAPFHLYYTARSRSVPKVCRHADAICVMRPASVAN